MSWGWERGAGAASSFDRLRIRSTGGPVASAALAGEGDAGEDLALPGGEALLHHIAEDGLADLAEGRGAGDRRHHLADFDLGNGRVSTKPSNEGFAREGWAWVRRQPTSPTWRPNQCHTHTQRGRGSV